MFNPLKTIGVLRHPGYNYIGGSEGSTTTVQKSDPWGPIQPFLLEGANAASDLYNANPGGIMPYAGPSVATLPSWLSGAITGGIDQSLQSAPFYQTAMWNSLSSALNPQATGYQQVSQSGQNPWLDSMAGDLVNRTQQAWGDTSRGMWEQLQEGILPGIEDQFNQAGQLGASRQALMQGQAVGRTNDALAREYGDLSSNLQGQLANLYGGVYENAMGRDLQAQLANQGAGLSAAGIDMQKLLAQMQTFPMLQSLSQFPMAQSTAALAAYSPLLAQQQSLYDVDKNSYYESAMAPWNALGQYASLINPSAGMGGTSSNTQPTYSNPVGQTLSAALPLAMMYFMM